MTLTTLTPELLEVATPEEREAYRKELERQKALLSPLDFLCYVSPDTTERFPHSELMNRYVTALVEHRLYDSGIGPAAVWVPADDDPEDGTWRHPETDEEAHNIMVLSVPPQHGKSLLVTETGPAWYLARHPDRRVVATGYEADFARTFGRKNQEKIQGLPEHFGIEVNPRTQAADAWDIKGTMGGMVTAGSGGALTGKGAHFMVVDDPVKNAKEALSEVSRKDNWDWWRSTVTSRIRADGVIVVIQTRWHEADLAGMVIENERCYVLSMPALAFEGDPDPVDGVARDPDTMERDPLGRKPGAALCPKLHTRSSLIARREANDDNDDEPGGMLWFSALYQGKPNIEGGGILAKPYRYFREVRDPSGRAIYITRDIHGATRQFLVTECIHFIVADMATSTKKSADFTVFANFAWTPDGHILLTALQRQRLESPDHPAMATKFYRDQVQRCGGVRSFYVEDKTFGTALIQDLSREGIVPVMPATADSDKVARAIPVGMRIKADRFYLPEQAEWLRDAEKEMQLFPNATHDDIVDTMGYAVSVSKHFPKRQPILSPKARTLHSKIQEVVMAKKKGRQANYHPTMGRF